MNLQPGYDPQPNSDLDDGSAGASSENSNEAIVGGLYRRFRSRLVVFLQNQFGPGPPYPDDIAHQAFAKLAERKTTTDIRDLESFVWASATNIMRSEIRKLRVRADYAQDRLHVSWGDDCDEFDAERVLLAKEALDIVADTLLRMPPRRRELFVLCRVDGLTPAAAGEKLGVSRSSAARHVSLASAMLVEALAGAGNIEPDPVVE